MSRRKRIDSTEAAVEVLAAASRELNPPVQLTQDQRPFWDAVISSRAKVEWNEADLITAAQLARTMERIEKLPAEDLGSFEKLSRLVLAMRRSLGLDVRGKDGRAGDVATRRSHALQVEQAGSWDDDGLIARPPSGPWSAAGRRRI